MTVLAAGSRELVVAYPDETMRQAVAKMHAHNIGRLPVVSRQDPERLVGYLGRAGVMSARMRTLEEERVRERSWGIGQAIRRA
jgi:CBS domain-containing protein